MFSPLWSGSHKEYIFFAILKCKINSSLFLFFGTTCERYWISIHLTAVAIVCANIHDGIVYVQLKNKSLFNLSAISFSMPGFINRVCVCHNLIRAEWAWILIKKRKFLIFFCFLFFGNHTLTLKNTQEKSERHLIIWPRRSQNNSTTTTTKTPIH